MTCAVRAGVLNEKFSRNQFDLCAHKLLTLNDVDQNHEVSLRTAVQVESKCGGQGFAKCNCAGTNKCRSNRCKCFKAHVRNVIAVVTVASTATTNSKTAFRKHWTDIFDVN